MIDNKNMKKPKFIGKRGVHKGVPDKPKNMKKTTKKFLKYIRPYMLKIILVVIFTVLSVLFTILNPKVLGTITTSLFTSIKNPSLSIDYKKILYTIVLLVMLYILSSLFTYVEQFIMSKVSQDIIYDIRKQMDIKIDKLSIKYIDSKLQGEILSRITNDVDTISTSLKQSMIQIIKSVTTIIGILIIMMSTNIIMTGITCVMLPISFIITSFITKKSQKYFTNQQKILGDYNSHIEETYSGNTIIKAYGYEKKNKERFDEINISLSKNGWKSLIISGTIMPILTLVSNVGYVALVVVGSLLAINNLLAIGNIQAFIQYSKQFNTPINQVANISSILQSTVAAAERIFEFLELEEEEDCINKIKENINITGKIEFRNVNFSYNKKYKIINNLNLDINPGDNIAIVGHTGAGKTTLVNLLMRFYEVKEGCIKIDGINIKDINRKELRNLFGMVLQDTWLFNGTIYDNIIYGKENSSIEEVKNAAKMAYADYFINNLPKGYYTKINEEGTNISAGQKQLITIARVILKNPRILILDEATSSVDTKTELAIQKGMSELMKDRTSLIIAHRLSTIKEADYIIVMDKGSIVERGKHEELIYKNGYYANLYYSQFKKTDKIKNGRP